MEQRCPRGPTKQVPSSSGTGIHPRGSTCSCVHPVNHTPSSTYVGAVSIVYRAHVCRAARVCMKSTTHRFLRIMSTYVDQIRRPILSSTITFMRHPQNDGWGASFGQDTVCTRLTLTDAAQFPFQMPPSSEQNTNGTLMVSPTSTARTASILHIDAVESMPCMQCYRYGTIPTPRTNLHVDGVARIHDLNKLVWQGQLKPIS